MEICFPHCNPLADFPMSEMVLNAKIVVLNATLFPYLKIELLKFNYLDQNLIKDAMRGTGDESD